MNYKSAHPEPKRYSDDSEQGSGLNPASRCIPERSHSSVIVRGPCSDVKGPTLNLRQRTPLSPRPQSVLEKVHMHTQVCAKRRVSSSVPFGSSESADSSGPLAGARGRLEKGDALNGTLSTLIPG